MTRYDTPTDYSPPTERRLEIRLLKWPMWKEVPWWNIRIAFKSRFLMFGPYELRFEYHVSTTKPKPEPKDLVELYGADPNCKHELDPNSMSGDRCLKCGGWFCY